MVRQPILRDLLTFHDTRGQAHILRDRALFSAMGLPCQHTKRQNKMDHRSSSQIAYGSQSGGQRQQPRLPTVLEQRVHNTLVPQAVYVNKVVFMH
jgi:hypothetical protein